MIFTAVSASMNHRNSVNETDSSLNFIFCFQSVELNSKSIPGNVLEFFVSGGKDLVVHPQAFTSLSGLSLVRIDGTQSVVLSRHSFYNISSPNLLIQVQNSRNLLIEASAFKNMQVNVRNVSSYSLA